MADREIEERSEPKSDISSSSESSASTDEFLFAEAEFSTARQNLANMNVHNRTRRRLVDQAFEKKLRQHPIILVTDGPCRHFYVIHDFLTITCRFGTPFIISAAEYGDEWRNAAARRAPNVLFPQLWVASKCIGAFADIVAMHDSGTLDRLMRSALDSYGHHRGTLASHHALVHSERRIPNPPAPSGLPVPIGHDSY